MTLQLRPYQQEAVDAIFHEFEHHDSTLLVLPTGGGKTLCFAKVAERFRPHGRILVLAHREELLIQAEDKIKQWTNLRTGIEQADKSVSGMFLPDVTIASIQTLSRSSRMEKFARDTFGLVIVDECFPAGTLIDGKPIETLHVGDEVSSFNHSSGQVERKKVQRVFVSRPHAMVRVHLSNGQQIACTFGHPFFTEQGYIPAGLLEQGQAIFSLEESHDKAQNLCGLRNDLYPTLLDPRNGSHLLTGLQTDSQGCTDAITRPVHCLHNNFPRNWELGESALPQNRPSLLFTNLQEHLGQAEFCQDYGINQSQIRLSAYERTQSHVQGQRQGENIRHPEGYQTQAKRAGWERERINCPTGNAVEKTPSRMEYRGSDSYQNEQGQRLSHSLQIRHCFPLTEDRRGGRWVQPLCQGTTRARSQEGRVSSVTRVDRVQILEPTSDGTFSGVCPDNFVYNIEVEDNHNYFADGILVHNCHHACSPTYLAVLKYFDSAKLLGVSATPERLDKKALGAVFQSVAYTVDIRDLIEQKYLVNIKQQAVEVHGLDLSKVRTTAGDLNEADLEKILMEERTLHEVALPTVELAENRQTLVFGTTVAHAEALTDVINRYATRPAKSIDGKMERSRRADIYEEFSNGDIQFLVNCMLVTEGVDIPPISCISMARPTKSKSLYQQMLGRGTRLYPGKEDLKVLDFVGNSGKHTLISALDILDGNTDLAVKARAQTLSKKNPKLTILQALEQAAEELATEQRQAVLAKAKFHTVDVDPFTVLGIHPRAGRWGGQEISIKQMAILDKAGIPYTGLDKGQASEVIDKIFSRREKGLCTVKMAKVLMKYGLNPDVSFEVASKQLNTIAQSGWKLTLAQHEQIARLAA